MEESNNDDISEQLDLIKSLLVSKEKDLSGIEDKTKKQYLGFVDEYRSLPSYKPFSMPSEYDLSSLCLNLPKSIIDESVIKSSLEQLFQFRNNTHSILMSSKNQGIMEKCSEILVLFDFQERIYQKIVNHNIDYLRFLEENHLMSI